jgi:hypothetical protein
MRLCLKGAQTKLTTIPHFERGDVNSEILKAITWMAKSRFVKGIKIGT